MSLVSKFGISDRTGTTNDPKLTVVHTAPVSLSQGTIQNINYTYDSVGNITNIADYSTSTGKIIDYTYDDLYRLTNATTSAASSTSYAHSYTYNAIGNLTTKSDIGSYTYAGTNYANPHAPTTINGVTYAYDNNGNLTEAGSNDYTWNYRDRLTQVATGTATVTYGYDHVNQRVWQRTSSSATTTYPNQFYSVTAGASSTTYIYAGNDLVAFVETGTTTSNASYVHPDHLGSTHIVTNASGTVAQAMDYYPYGNTRVDSNATNLDLKKQYIGKYFDETPTLSYLEARYYSGDKGQFLSQDPVFWQLGQIQAAESILVEPQMLNSYSYASNDPINNKDPLGLLTQTQKKQLQGIASQLRGIQAKLKSGKFTKSQLGSFQETINSARATISRIAVGGNATLSPAMQWAPPTTPGYVAPYAPNIANGLIPIRGTDADKNLALGILTAVSPLPGDEFIAVGIAGKASAELVEVNGYKFTAKYLQKLWETGRTAPGYRAEAIEKSASKIITDPEGRVGFLNYYSETAFSKVWYMTMNPVTKEVWHISPL